MCAHSYICTHAYRPIILSSSEDVKSWGLSPVALGFIDSNTFKKLHYLLKIVAHVSPGPVFSPLTHLQQNHAHMCTKGTNKLQLCPRSKTVSVLKEFMERETERGGKGTSPNCVQIVLQEGIPFKAASWSVQQRESRAESARVASEAKPCDFQRKRTGQAEAWQSPRQSLLLPGQGLSQQGNWRPCGEWLTCQLLSRVQASLGLCCSSPHGHRVGGGLSLDEGLCCGTP